jgi:1,6-anhydro-N-acetylmuramate kinase
VKPIIGLMSGTSLDGVDAAKRSLNSARQSRCPTHPPCARICET